MAGSNIDLLGSFMLERYSLKPFAKFLNNSPFISSPSPSSKRRLLVKTTPLAALTAEDLMMKHVTTKEPAVNTFKVAAPIEEDLGNLAMKDVAKEAVLFKVTALVTLRHGKKENMKEMMLHWLDSSTYPTQNSVVLQLVSTEIDPRTMEAKLSKEAVLDSTNSLKFGGEKVTHEVDFMVDSNFGMSGGITVNNKYLKEFFLESVTIEGFVHFACNSWVQPEKINAGKRIFFSNKWSENCRF